MPKFYKNYGFTNVLIMLMATLMVAFYVWLVLEEDPLTVTRTHDNTIVHHVEVGGKFTFTRNVCNKVDHLQVNVQRRIINLDSPSTQYVLVDIPYYATGGCVVLTFETDIPKTIPPGRYQYRPHIFYSLNQFNHVSKPLPPENFVVR